MLSRELAVCLQKEGWDATVGLDPTGYFVDYDAPPGQDLALESDASECKRKTGFAEPPSPMSRKELEALYVKQLETRSCLQAEGYRIVTPPPKEAFVEEGGAWLAYGSLDPNKDKSGDPAEWARINKECPQP